MRTCTRKTLRSVPPDGSAMRLDMPFPQYVASFSKRTFVSGSVRGRILNVCVVEVVNAIAEEVWFAKAGRERRVTFSVENLVVPSSATALRPSSTKISCRNFGANPRTQLDSTTTSYD
jgi:hypothetical protein